MDSGVDHNINILRPVMYHRTQARRTIQKTKNKIGSEHDVQNQRGIGKIEAGTFK